MAPGISPHERRRFRRLPMATRECQLTLIGTSDTREVCTLIDLSYAGLRFRTHWHLVVGESAEFLLDMQSPVRRSGFATARIRWIRALGFQEYDAGAEFSEKSKGSFLGSDEISHNQYSASNN